MRSAFDRRTEIITAVQVAQRVSTRALSELFDVSEVTIRQDLSVLEDQGWLARVHGGAVAVSRLHREETRAEREMLNIEEKRRIGKAAAAMVYDGDAILIDSSTTAFQMTPFLADKRDLKVITNQFHVARVLSPLPGMQVILLGGSLRVETWSIVGPLVEEMLGHLYARIGFFGAGGLTIDRGLTDADPRESQTKRAMSYAVEHVVALVDGSKFGRQALMQSIPLERVSRLITAGAPDEFCTALAARGLHIENV